MINEAQVIDNIKLYEISIPMEEPFQISGGVSYFRKSLIVVLESEGVKGYGEAAPFEQPFYSSETISSVKALYTELLFKRFIGRRVESIEELNELLSIGVRGNNFAKAGIENAYWDLICRKNKVSLKKLIEYKLRKLGVEEKYLSSKPYLESGVSIGIPVDGSLETLKKWASDYVKRGYRRIKIKVKPGWDIEAVKVVRETIGMDFPFWIDANSSYDYDEYKDIFKTLDAYKCLFYEQPLHHDDILDHSKLAEYVKTPICLDESLKSSKVARQVLETKASSIWNIKIQRIGGLLEGIKIYKIAVENGIKLWGGTMPESGIGAMPIMALASFEGFHYPADIEDSERWYGKGKDLIEIHMDEYGRINVPEAAGIESLINFENLEKYGKIINW